MNNFINKLLNEKNKKKNKEICGNIDKNKTNDYLDSCIIFIYKNGNNALILNEIQKLNPQKLPLFLIINRDHFIFKENIYMKILIYYLLLYVV